MPGILSPGDAVVTGFSGTLPPPQDLPAGADPLDYVFIDPDGSSMQIERLLPSGPPAGQLIDAPALFTARARDVGQVFAITLDDAPAPDIYLGATSAFGIHIVAPDGAGTPRHAKQGTPGAQFMDGQWGTDKGGAPGSIYKVDGTTGDITLFSSIGTNAGPGLGDVVFDRASRQFFVSDLDTGLIYRLDATGLIQDTYDHGVTARPLKGLPPVADDGSRMDISKPAFNSEDPASWGLTPPERRVGGMAVHGGRLYYAVAVGPQVWSVGINLDGSFRDDPRWELDVASPAGNGPVTDIVFDANGRMILAQRGAQRGSFDDSVFADPKTSSVLRYSREVPDDPATPGTWVPVPDEYAVGFRPELRNTNGGVALGYGYDSSGFMRSGSCNAFLWTTGEALRDDPALAAQLSAGGPATVDGLQGNDASLVRPANVPPFSSYFTDFDGNFDHPERQGWMGDVEIYQPCVGGTQGYVPPPLYFPPGLPPSGSFNLTLDKLGAPQVCLPGGLGWMCYYTIRVTNTGTVPYWGPLTINEWMPGMPPGAIASFDFLPWICGMTGPFQYQCTLPGTFLMPGDSVDLFVTVNQPMMPNGPINGHLCYGGNSAGLLWWNGYGDADPWDDMAYAQAQLPDPACLPQGGGTNLRIEKRALDPICFVDAGDWFCRFEIKVTNTGPGVYSGPVTVNDEPLPPAFFDYAPKPNPPDWTCVPSGGGNQTCTHAPVTLNPGESVMLWILLKPSIAQQEQAGLCNIRNRVHIVSAPGGSPANLDPSDDSAEAEALTLGKNCQPSLGEKSDLSLTKTAIACTAAVLGGGEACSYSITVTNHGPDTFSGHLTVHDETAPNPGALPQMPPFWSCAPVGAGVDCTADLSGMPLAPGASITSPVMVVVPLQSNVCDLSNTAKIVAPVAGSNSNWDGSNDTGGPVSLAVPLPSCNPPPAPHSNLWIEKKANGCEASTGQSSAVGALANQAGNVACSYVVTLHNDGPNDVAGPVAFSDQPVAGTSTHVTANDAGWTCTSLAPNASCSTADGLAANTSVTFNVVVSTTADLVRQNNCEVGNRATITEPLGWPLNSAAPDDISEAVANAPAELCGQQKVLKQEFCPPERQMPDQGCCPVGEKWNGRTCSGGKSVQPTPLTPVTKVCPPGSKGTYPNCRTTRQKVCPSDSVGEYPDCRCKRGTYGNPGNCRSRQCPQGTYGDWPNCAKPLGHSCPQGTHGKWPNCLKNVCPSGTLGNWPDCTKPVRRSCQQGTHGKWPDCQPNVCPSGTVGNWPNCTREVQRCPKGTKGKWPNCRTVETGCPEGFVFNRKRKSCVKIQEEVPQTAPTQRKTFQISPNILLPQQQTPQ